MLARLRALKAKHFALEGELKQEVNHLATNDIKVKEIKKKKLHLKDTIMKLVRKKSTHRTKRYSLRTKRLSRIGSIA